MNDVILHETPAWRSVLRAEINAVGIAARPALAVAGTLVGAATIIMILGVVGEGMAIDVSPELAYVVALIAPLLPLAIWKGEYQFRRSYIASTPVARASHVMAKVAVGWVWLLFLLAAFLLWMLTLAVVTGGAIGIDLTRLMIGVAPAALPDDLGALEQRWVTPAWHWAVFFTGPTVTYLIGSALVLAGRSARRWLAGIIIGSAVLLGAAEHDLIHLGSAVDWFERVAETVMEGRYGLLELFAVVDSDIYITPAGDELRVWGHLPSPGDWILSTVIWVLGALGSLAAVLWRDRTR